jgi:hypothetical protein
MKRARKKITYRVILSVLDPRKCEYLAGHFRKHEASRSALPGQWRRTYPASPLVSHEAMSVVIYACTKSNEESLRYSHFLESSTERITLYNI